MKLASITQLKEYKSKRFLLRVDYNVALDKRDNVLNEELFRLQRTIPTIKYLQERGAKIIILTHRGRPNGKPDPKLSNKPLAKALQKELDAEVIFVQSSIGKEAKQTIAAMVSGDIIMLENLKFHPGEDTNSQDFALQLAELGEVLVNDAFASVHRTLASMVALSEHLPVYAGLLLQEELEQLNTKLIHHQEPLVVVMGGAKSKTKLPFIEKLLPRAEYILTGGILANTLLAATGADLGASVVEASFVAKAKKLIKNKNILLPKDVICDRVSTEEEIEAEQKNIQELINTDRIIDIGTVTAVEYATIIRSARTVFFNGPLGFMEKSQGRHGSQALAEFIAALTEQGSLTSIVGGGETAALFAMLGLQDSISYVSTGGGALLAYITDQNQPGLQPLYR